MNLKFMRRVCERELVIRQFVIVKTDKLMSVFNASVLLLIMNFVMTLPMWSADPLGYHLMGSTATPTTRWRNSWSITGQTHKKTDVNLFNILPNPLPSTLGSRGYFFLIDTSRRSRVNEARSAEEKKITSGHRSTQPHFHARNQFRNWTGSPIGYSHVRRELTI